ncbi:alpha/beta hydrolase [Qipengyuania thermophila]|uniref:alpha/beta hydrolase n=1 Tax=Qipengyuania thermophila TaxID=2509361 RepID=UPI001F45071D|nr:alpha/beta hydrolase [Qipengyuania thermophila]
MPGRPPVICLHGLTRNGRDFHRLALWLAESGWEVIVPDMRGRGQSERATDPSSYAVEQYVRDVDRLRTRLGIDRYVAIGTSMGGLMTLVTAATEPDVLAAAALNDIGPEVEPEGLRHILGYIGRQESFLSWSDAAEALRQVHGQAHPAFSEQDWLDMARRTMVEDDNERIVFDYDPAIAAPLQSNGRKEAAVPPDLWPAFTRLSARPLLLIRGAHSTLLSARTFARMQGAAPAAATVEVADAGHAPTLDEPEVRAALATMLARVD